MAHIPWSLDVGFYNLDKHHALFRQKCKIYSHFNMLLNVALKFDQVFSIFDKLHLIWGYSVGLSRNNIIIENLDAPKNRSGLIQMINLGKSIGQKWVKCTRLKGSVSS